MSRWNSAYDEGREDAWDEAAKAGASHEEEVWTASLAPMIDLLAAYGLCEGCGAFDEAADVANYLPQLARDLARRLGDPVNPDRVPDIPEVRDELSRPGFWAWRGEYYGACLDRAKQAPGAEARLAALETIGVALGATPDDMKRLQAQALASVAEVAA